MMTVEVGRWWMFGVVAAIVPTSCQSPDTLLLGQKRCDGLVNRTRDRVDENDAAWAGTMSDPGPVHSPGYRRRLWLVI